MMKTLWNIGERRPQDRAERRFQSIAMHLPPRRRVDAVLTVGLIVSVVGLLAIAAVVFVYGERQGWFDAPLVQPLRDPRKLVNVRDELAQNPLLDAVFHQADDRVYISQQGGTIHRYDPATELWSTLHPFSDDPVSPNLVQLRSGCGTDPLSARLEECADPNSLWMLGADGSLARLNGRRWEVVINNSAFLGANGKPVESEELTSAAVSENGRWLVLGTRANGIGVYDLSERLWLGIQPDVMDTLPSQEISHVAFWRDSFWLGTPSGLARLEVTKNKQSLSPAVLDGRIVDLAAEEKHLWILAERRCDRSGDLCTWLGQLENPNRAPKEVLAEHNRYADLSLAAVNHAQYWDNHLILAGEAGIYLYDSEVHAWDQLFADPVQTVLTDTTNLGMFFGYSGGVGKVEPSFITATWPITDELVVKLLSVDEDLLALTARGNTWNLSETGKVTQVFRHSNTTLDPTGFNAAVAAGDTVLFMGSDGALLHNVRTRQYEDLTVGLPDWLLSSDTRFVTAGDTVFAVEYGDNDAVIHLLPIDQLANASYFSSHDIADATAVPVPSTPQDLWPWEPYGLGLIASNGRAYLVDDKGTSPQIGTGVQFGLNELRDVAEANDALIAARSNDLYSYSLRNRSWSTRRRPGLAADEEIVEITALGDRLFVQTSLGRLLQESGAWANLIGDATGFGISDSALSDAVARGQTYYLAGGGRVEAYDANDRVVVQSWDIQGDGAVSLHGIVGGKPLALSNGIAYLGTTPLDPEAGPVSSLSSDDTYIWTIRESDSGRYLLGHSINAPTSAARETCFFRQSQIRGVEHVLDARLLPDDTVVTMTEQGLHLYSPAARSWYRVQPDTFQIESKLYLLDDDNDGFLLVEEPGSDSTVRLHFVPVESIQLPHSCSTEPATMMIQETRVAISADVNEQSGRVAWLEPNGSVWEWAAGNRTQLLAPSDQGPSLAGLHRVYKRDTCLLFVADSTLWRYDLEQRYWQRITLSLSDETNPIVGINVERDGDQDVVTVRMGNDDFYLGTLANGRNSVRLNRIYRGEATTFDAEAEDLVDVQRRTKAEKLWTFVLADRVQYYDPEARDWERVEPVASSTPLSFQEALGRGILVGNGGQSWWVSTQRASHPVLFSEFTREPSDIAVALEANGTIWRLSPDGQVHECSPQDGVYLCENHGPAAFSLDPATVEHAFGWDPYILFETPNGLRAFNGDTNAEVALPSEAASFHGTTASYQLENQLWLYNGTGLLSLDRNLQSVLKPGVSDLLLDTQNHIWADLPGGWHQWKEGTWEPVAEVTSAVQGMQIFVLPGTTISAVDDANVGHYWSGTRFLSDDLSLPEGLPEIEHLIHGPTLDWWIVGQGRVYHVKRALCRPTEGLPTPAVTPAATFALTLTATPPVTPAATTPCLELAGYSELHLADVVYAQPLSDERVELRSSIGQSVVIAAEADGEYTATLTSGVDSRPDLALDDLWPTIQENVIQLPDGQWAYDPPIDLDLSASSELVVRRGSGSEELLARSAVIAGTLDSPFSSPSELDVGWLRWDRTNRSFLVQSATGLQRLGPEQFIQNGQLAFESVSAVLAPRTDTLYAATDSGVWAFGASNLGLDNEDITYYPPSPNTALIQDSAHGRFVAGTVGISVEPSGLREMALDPIRVQVGDVTFIEQTASGQVDTSLRLGNRTLPAAIDRSFTWDSNRRNVAYEGDVLMLQSDAGIHEAQRLAGFDAGPSQVTLSESEIRSDGQGNLYLFHHGDWYQRLASIWTDRVPDPLASGTLVRTPYWEWTRKDGAVVISLTDRPYAFRVIHNNGNLGFNFDRIQAGVAYGNELFVSTGAFLEIAGKAEELGSLAATRLSPIVSDRFRVFRVNDNQEALFSYWGSQAYRWDGQQSGFSAVEIQNDPSYHRVLLEAGRLRLSWDQGQVIKDVWLDRIDGSSRWVPFNFYRGRFPFDYVTSLAAFDNRLYVGTAAGLQIYDENSEMALDHLTRLLDAGAQPRDFLDPIIRVGIPANQDNLLIAEAEEGCIEQSMGQPFSHCSTLEPLQLRLKVKSSFWQWTQTPHGEIMGRYVTSDGGLADEQIEFVDGRWPHDTFADVAVCQGRLYTLWHGGWTSAHGGPSFVIDDTIQNHEPPSVSPQRLICLEQSVAMSNRDLPGGLYLESEGSRVWAYDNNGWREISDPVIVTDLRQYATTPPLFYGSHLRLLDRSMSGEFAFEQRSLDGHWHALPWLETGQVAIDEWHEMVFSDGDLWVATAAGLVAFERGSKGTDPISLDPDALTIVREPLLDGSLCTVTDLALKGEAVLARCNYRSDQVYQGTLSRSQDRQVFTSSDTDPFAGHSLVSIADTGYWSFDLVGRAGGRPGFLQAELRDEQIQLVAGRFQFDTINSLALFQQETVELGTEAGGWYQAPRSDRIGVSDLTRSPIAPEVGQVNWVGLTGPTGDQALCLRSASGTEAILLDADYAVQSRPSTCAEYQGEASLWLYQAEDDHLLIDAPDAIGGRGTRFLLGGRFNDDIALGLPVANKTDDKLSYLVPTAGGVVRWDRDLRGVSLHAGPFEGLMDGQAPHAVYMLSPNTAAYVGDGALYELGDTRDPIQDLDLGSLKGTRVQAIDAGPWDSVLVRWLRGSSQGWSLLASDNGSYAENMLVVDVSEFEKYIQHQLGWGSPIPLLTIIYNSGQIGISFGSQPTFFVELPAQFELIAPILSQDRVLLIGRQDLFELDLETGMVTAIDPAKSE